MCEPKEQAPLEPYQKGKAFLSYKKKKEKIACQLTIKIKEVIMAYAVFKMCSRASTRHASDGFPLIFFFSCSKKGLFEPFFVVRQDQLPTTHTRERAGSPGACHQVVYYTRSVHFPPALYQVRSTWKRTTELSLLKKVRKENKKFL